MNTYETRSGHIIFLDPKRHEPNSPMYPNGFRGAFDFLSNFSWSKGLVVPVLGRFPSWMRGKKATTVENAFQAAKFYERPSIGLLEEFGLDGLSDPDVLLVCDPGVAKRIGRNVELSHDWPDRSIDVMDALLREKFSDPQLKQRLIATHPMRLIEWNSWYDDRWGVPIRTMTGSNILGQLLSYVRHDCQLVTE